MGMMREHHSWKLGVGVEKDEHKGFNCFKKLAKLGDFRGMSIIGYCYWNDIGMQIYIEKANYWFQAERTWIPNEFQVARMSGKGCFSTVYLARWKSSDLVKYYQYIKMHCEIGVGNPSFMKYFRIARIENETHFFVLKYAYMGSLLQNIHEITKMNWQKDNEIYGVLPYIAQEALEKNCTLPPPISIHSV
ncbi:hypothetical protein C2G38_2042193 [Gigaspora rosea]|uniref:Protein kinase domain-containing protein n=1 Tax=Gigaspora rosea TaxID=44941 RepID=A0A397URL4_9GLOM|nr:hypothetical protein C2G38_2042193 [Gigaspora rosea]